MDGRILLITLSLALASCGSPPPAPFPRWVPTTLAYTPDERSSNGFDKYALAALEAETKAASYVNQVNFLPKARGAAMAACQGAVAQVAAATRLDCKFEFRPTAPFTPPLYQRGWRLIGRCLVWNIEKSFADGNAPAAVRWFAIATRFGFDLTRGGALDASLGFFIVNDARVALLKGSGKLQAADFEAAANGIRTTAGDGPRRAADVAMLENERQNMVLAVQYIQDKYEAHKLDILDERLLVGARPAVTYLRQMRGKDGTARVKYFEGFADEADKEVANLIELYQTLPSDRSKVELPELAEDRPWRRFTPHFFDAARHLLPVRDLTVARTRLFIIHALTQAQVRRTGRAPEKALGGELNLDPHSGNAFIYRAEGRDYRLYSVGADGVDNGASTNTVLDSPDLLLELP